MGTSDELAILIRAQNLTQQAFDSARKDLEKLGQQGQKTNDLLGGLKTGLGAIGVAFSATAVLGFAKDILDTAGHVNDLAHAIGISTDAVQDFTLAAEQSGATIDDVGIAINKLNVEAGNNSAGFEKLGLSLEKIQALSPEERFRAVADALQQIEDPAVRAALGQELLGKGYRNLASAIDEGIGKTRDVNKMSKETIETLDGLGDAIVRAGTKTKNFFGEALAKAVNIPRDLIRDMKADLDRLGISIDTIVAKAPGIPAAFRGQGAIRLAPLNTEEIAQIEDGLNKERKALDETAKAADQHAQKIKELNDAIFGRTAITAANDYVQALGPINNLSKVSAENQKKMNATVIEAIEAYDRLGKTAPAALNQIYVLTASLPEATRGVANVIKDLGYEAEVAIPKLYDLPKPVALTSEELELLGRKSSLTLKDLIPEAALKSKASLDEIANSLGRLGAMAPGSFGAVVSGLAQVVSALEAAKRAEEQFKGANAGIASALFSDDATASQKWASGIASASAIASGAISVWSSTAHDATKKAGAFHGAMSGAEAGAVFGPYGMAVGAAAGAIAGLIHTLSAGRREVIDFAKSFDTAAVGSGFDELRKKLLVLGDEGERLWIKLTQGTKKGDKAGAAAVIDEITTALGKVPPSIADNIAAAGYQTRAALQAAADTAGKVYKSMEDSGLYTADVLKQAWQAWQDALVKSGDATVIAAQKTKDAIKGIDDQISSLQDSIAGEAPEEFMGVVERETRDRIAALAEQRKQLEEQLQQQQEDTKDATADVASGVGDVTDNAEAALSVFERWKRAILDAGGALGDMRFPGGESPEPGASHASGAYIRRDHVARVHAGEIIGPVDFMRRALKGAIGSGGSDAHAASQPIVIQIDGREIARTSARYQRQVLAPYGVR
jgi:hypothetical protein